MPSVEALRLDDDVVGEFCCSQNPVIRVINVYSEQFVIATVEVPKRTAFFFFVFLMFFLY